MHYTKQHSTGAMFELPLGLRPKFHEIGAVWTDQTNFNTESALVVSSELQAQHLISKLAPNQQVASLCCVWPALLHSWLLGMMMESLIA
eukprot:2270572-Lingulodinium_polyedra.AAC.1